MSDPQQQSHDPSAFYSVDLSAIPLANRGSLPEPTSLELWQAGSDDASDRRFNGERERVKAAYAPILEVLNAGRPRRFWRTDADATHAFTNPGEWAPADEGGGGEREKEETLIWGAISAARARDPNAYSQFPKSIDGLRQQIITDYQARRDHAAAISDRNQSWFGGGAAKLRGGLVTGLNDPLVIATLPVGGAGKTIAQRILLQGLVGAGTQALAEPTLAKHMGDLGDPLTPGQAATDILSAGASGVAFQAALGEPLHAVMSAAARGVASTLTPTERSAAHVLDRETHVEGTSPFTAGAGTEEHVARTNQALHALTAEPGTVSLTPPPAVADPNARAHFMSRVRMRESGGSDTARPIDPATGKPLSTAVGRYQFTADTWTHYYSKRFDTTGLTRAQILAKRTDGGLQDVLMQDMTADNARHLARLGLPETAGNLYTEHFLGQGGAEKVFRADPNTPIESLLTARAINANKFLKGKTAGDVIAWAHARMGETPHNGPMLRRGLFGSDDEFAAAQHALDSEERNLAAVQAEGRAPVADEPAPSFHAIDPAERPSITAEAPVAPDLAGEPPAPIRDYVDRYIAGDSRADAATEQFRTSNAAAIAQEFQRRETLAGTGQPSPTSEVRPTAPSGATDETMLSSVFVAPKGEPGFHIEDSDGDGHYLYSVFRDAQGAPKGVVRYPASAQARAPFGGHSYGVTTYIDPAYRRQGLATKLYNQLRDSGHDVDRVSGTSDLTPEGAAFVNTRRAKAASDAKAAGERAATMQRAREEIAAEYHARAQQEAAAPTPDREALSRYDQPGDGAGPRTAMESLEHDIRMDAAANPDQTVRLSDEAGEQRIADVLDDLDQDKAAVEAARHCMAPPA